MQGHMIVVMEEKLGPIYADPKSISSAYPISGEDTHREDGGYVLQAVYGSRFTLTMAEWEKIKPYLVAGEDSELQAALNTAIKEGADLARKLSQAEQRIRNLEALQTLSVTSASPTQFQTVSKADADEAIRRAGTVTSIPTTAEELEQALRSDMAEIMQQPADTPPPPHTSDEGGHVVPGSGFISGFRSSRDTSPSEPESMSNNVRIIRVEKADFFSKTSGSRRPMWRMTTDDGRTVTAFDHSDPLRDHKPMLQQAGYLDMFAAYPMGATAYWDAMPILAEIAPDGKFWKLIRIEKRTALQIPDRVDTADKLKPAQLAVCKEAAAMLERDDLVVFDCETTGLADDDEVVEIAGFLLDPNHPDPHFSTLVKPTDMTLLHRPNKKKQTAIDIHGIGENMLADAPKMSDPEVLNLLSEFMDKKAWASFNIEFDERLLYQGLDAAGIHDGFPEGRKNFCIQKMMNRYLGREWVSLDDACKALGIERSQRHRAEADASDALDVLKALADKVPAENTQDIPF